MAGPCVTLLLPRYRPGEPSEPAAAILKTDLQEAAKKLVARRIAEPLIAELLEPLYKLSRDEELLAGSGSGRVIFRALGVLRQFELPVAPSPEQACTVERVLLDPSDSSIHLSADERLRARSDEKRRGAAGLQR